MGFIKSFFLRDEIVVAVSEYASYGVILLLALFIKYNYGVEQLGEFNFSFSYAQFLLLGFGAGFNLLLRRDFLTNTKNKRSYFNRIIFIKIIISLVSLLVSLLLFYFFLSTESTFLLILFLISKIFDSFSDLFMLLCLINSDFKYFSFLKIAYSAFQILTIGLIFFVSNVFSLQTLYLSILGCSIINFFIILLSTKTYRRTISQDDIPDSQLHGYKYILKEVYPLLINTLVFQIASKFIIISIFFTQGPYISGLFSIGMIIVSILSNISLAFGNVVFNKIKLNFNNGTFNFTDYEKVVKTNLRNGIYSFIIGVLFFCILYFLTDFLEKNTIIEYIIICLAIIPIFVVNVIGNMFVITNKQYSGMIAGIRIAILNIFFLTLVSVFFKSFMVLTISYVLSQFFQYLILNYSIKKTIFNAYV